MSALDDIQNNTPTESPCDPYDKPLLPLAKLFAESTDPGISGLVAQFKEADVPHSNPPEAATVLETQTAPEVAGNPEPLTEEQVAEIAKAEKLEEFNAERATRGEKPLKRMPPERKTRRTAPVVQVELDKALAEIMERDDLIASQTAIIEQLKAGVQRDRAIAELQADLVHEKEITTTLTAKITELHAEIERLHALPMTASAVQDRDKTIAGLRAEIGDRDKQITEASLEIIALAKAIAVAENVNLGLESLSIEDIVECMAIRGWKVTLSR